VVETALDGISVLELCSGISGPYCAKILADYGADVVKVEAPGLGDGSRSAGPFPHDEPNAEASGLFLYLNTNKKSVALNLESPAGRRLFRQMAALADVVVENLGPATTGRLGVDYETLKEVNSGLVMTSLSAFGQSGPYCDCKATDLTVWALSGILYECGEADREPLKIGSEQTEYVAGLYGALATLAALFRRGRSGAGQHLDVSSWEAFNTTEPYMTLLVSQMGGYVRKRAGIHWPWGILPCKDGYVGFFFPTQVYWESLCVLMEMPELRDRPEYETPLMRDQHAGEINSIITAWLKDKTMEEVFHAAQELRLPLTPVPDMAQIADLPQHRARGYFVEIDHPVAGRLTYPGAMFGLDETPWRAGRAPLLGEHNHEVYVDRLGYTNDDLATLRHDGVI